VTGPLPPPVATDRLRLTSAGRGLLIALVVLLAAAFATGYAELFGLAIACLFAVAVALSQLARRPRFDVRREITPDRLQRGAAAVGLLEVRNAGRTASPGVTAVDLLGRRRSEVAVPGLAPGATWRTTYTLDTSRRGAFLVGPLTLEQRDVFSLLERRRALGQALPLWVHPTAHPVTAPPGALARDLDGPESASTVEGSIAFSGLRDYQPGDDLRQVHWRTTARTGTLVVRTHVDTSRPDVLLLLDDRHSSHATEEGFEEAVSLVASIAVGTMRAGFTARVELVSRTPFARGDATAVLDGLAAVERTDPGRDEMSLGRAAQEAGRGAGGSCAVAVLGPGAVDEIGDLSALQRRWSTVAAAVVSTSPLSGRTGGIELLAGADAAAIAAEWDRRRWR
jgi:uncharacterized protein (DUF58 family)